MDDAFTEIELQYYIQKLKKERSEYTLIALAIILKEIKVFVPIVTNSSNENFCCFTKFNKVWLICFSSKDCNTSKYRLKKINFVDLINECLGIKNVSGVVINPLSDVDIYLENKVLKFILDQ